MLQGEEAAPEAINPVSNKSELVAGVRVTGYGDEEALSPAGNHQGIRGNKNELVE